MAIHTKVSPDERITMNALDNFDPFARNGVPTKPLNQPKVAKKPGRPPKTSETLQNEVRNVEITTETEGKSDLEPICAEKLHTNAINTVFEAKTEEIPQKSESLQLPIVESRNSEGLPSYRCEFEGRDIFVGFSCYKATNPVTAFALINMGLDFGRDKIRFDFSVAENTFYHSRNELAKKFLETDAKWLLLIDNDIVPSIGRPAWAKASIGAARNLFDLPLQRHVIHRLIGSGKTLVGGAYFANMDKSSIVCSNKGLADKAKAYTDEIAEVDWIGSGCLLIHRKVLLAMEEKNENLNKNFFYPDDISFCKRAKDAGHQPHIDLGLPVFHVGVKSY